MKRKTRLIIFFIVTAILVEFDQITKAVAEAKLSNSSGFDIIPGVFKFLFLRNPGAAWGMLNGKLNLFFIITFVIVLGIVYVIVRMPEHKKYNLLFLCLTVLTSGAIGNFIDRVRFGSVRDFLYFELIDFPVFNVADIYVTLSVILLIILIFFVYKDEDFNFLRGEKC